eukprot:CAMPEP_0170183684 /NCGR_PEP_ID=MMETSP0040_2-20121228/31418_1 /TAXON_ID=641309 /ORGANISM="Lotharella oceanica, Strain CCMP622" /LENGTH=78 /DNA_ID=CAMNT_0010429503 /DNA_START=650 /DNA_END=886 /DNA_ORIENTATION=+
MAGGHYPNEARRYTPYWMVALQRCPESGREADAPAFSALLEVAQFLLEKTAHAEVGVKLATQHMLLEDAVDVVAEEKS